MTKVHEPVQTLDSLLEADADPMALHKGKNVLQVLKCVKSNFPLITRLVDAGVDVNHQGGECVFKKFCTASSLCHYKLNHNDILPTFGNNIFCSTHYSTPCNFSVQDKSNPNNCSHFLPLPSP